MNLTKFIERASALGALGVKVTQNGVLIGEWFAEGEIRRNVYSVTKSFVSFAMGCAVEEGLISLEERLVDIFKDELPERVDANMKEATVRDLLTMRLGQERSELMGERWSKLEEDDWVRYSLSRPFICKPGERFLYSNVGPYLAGIIIQRRAGCSLIDYLTPRLFEPLSIKRPTWETDPLGNSFGSSGLMLTLSEFHKFGLLYLNKGVWNGKRLISEKWIEESTKKQYEDGVGYGYLFWRGERNSYRADGMFGQLCIVFPDDNAVVSIVSECRNVPALFEVIYGEICRSFNRKAKK
ncbi:MAG: serine hydrolase [Clostridia bacterium]|nr:serine hydrolase [Clostridia bacterium]